MSSLGKAHGVLDAGHDSLPLEDCQKCFEVRAAADDRGVDVPGQPHHAARDHRDAPNDHARARCSLQPRDEGPERFVQRVAELRRTLRGLRALRAHRANRSFSFPQAARACSTARTRTASGASMRRSGQSDQRSSAPSKDSSAVSTGVVARDAWAASSWPAIMPRNASGEPKKREDASAAMRSGYHTGRGAGLHGDEASSADAEERASGRRAHRRHLLSWELPREMRATRCRDRRPARRGRRGGAIASSTANICFRCRTYPCSEHRLDI